jgi:hypothetical protein
VHAQFGEGKWLDLGTIEEIRPRHCFQIADSHMRRQITGISFLCALHYLNLLRNFPIPDGRSLRAADAAACIDPSVGTVLLKNGRGWR